MRVTIMDFGDTRMHFNVDVSGILFQPWTAVALRTFRTKNEVKWLPAPHLNPFERELVYDLMAEIATYGGLCHQKTFPDLIDPFQVRLLSARDIRAAVRRLSAAGVRTQWAPMPGGGIYICLWRPGASK